MHPGQLKTAKQIYIYIYTRVQDLPHPAADGLGISRQQQPKATATASATATAEWVVYPDPYMISGRGGMGWKACLVISECTRARNATAGSAGSRKRPTARTPSIKRPHCGSIRSLHPRASAESTKFKSRTGSGINTIQKSPGEHDFLIHPRDIGSL